MTIDNKPTMFGPSSVVDTASYTPSSGKSALMNELISEFAGKPKAVAEAIIGNCTTTIPFKFAFNSKDTGHTVAIETTRNGMSFLVSDLQHEQVKAGGVVSVMDIGLSKPEKI